MFFSQDWRERIKAENPDAGFGLFPWFFLSHHTTIEGFVHVCVLYIGEIGKLLGAKWKELDESEKKVCRFVIGLWLRICF